MEVKIRYNTNAKSEDTLHWRVLIDSVEHLASNVVINCMTHTTKDYIEGVGDKWHVSCTGELEVKNGIAHITVKRKDNALKRHILKTISYRILGTLTTVGTAYYFSSNLALSSIIGVGELLLKPILYFLHERVWYRFGKTGR